MAQERAVSAMTVIQQDDHLTAGAWAPMVTDERVLCSLVNRTFVRYLYS